MEGVCCPDVLLKCGTDQVDAVWWNEEVLRQQGYCQRSTVGEWSESRGQDELVLASTRVKRSNGLNNILARNYFVWRKIFFQMNAIKS